MRNSLIFKVEAEERERPRTTKTISLTAKVNMESLCQGRDFSDGLFTAPNKPETNSVG